MNGIRLSLFAETRAAITKAMNRARALGDVVACNRCRAILSIGDGHQISVVAAVLGVSVGSAGKWIKDFMSFGSSAIFSKKSPGRPSKLSKTQRKELAVAIKEGPEKSGFPGACWRSPMIQDLIQKRFGKFYSVNYISQLLKNLGFSYQKARFTAAHRDPETRKEWHATIWPQVLKTAKEKHALILFGDEASFPQFPSGEPPALPGWLPEFDGSGSVMVTSPRAPLRPGEHHATSVPRS